MRPTLSLCLSLSDCLSLNDFLRRSVGEIGGLHTWEPRRWEGLLFHRDHNGLLATRARVAQEVAIARRDGKVVGAVTPEYPGGVFIQSHPDDTETTESLLDWALENLRQPRPDGGQWLEVWCHDYDEARARLLTERGFAPTSEHQLTRRRDLDATLGHNPVAPGYTVRGIEGDADHQRMAELLNAAFGRDFHSAEEFGNFAALAPSYRADLHLVAVAPDGGFAAHAGFTAHAAESFAVVEPVCTHPDHQGKGLAQALMAEGLRRLEREGIRTAYIGAWYSNPVSNHVYERMGFTSPVADRIWRLDS